MNDTKPMNASDVTVVVVGPDVPDTTAATPTGVATAITTPASSFAFFGTRIRETVEALKEAF